MKSISILTTVIRPMIKFDLVAPQDFFHQEVNWTLAMHYHLSTLSALEFDRVHHFPHALPQEKDIYCLREGNQ